MLYELIWNFILNHHIESAVNRHWANNGYERHLSPEKKYERCEKLDCNIKSNTQLLFFVMDSLPVVLLWAWHFSLSLPAPRLFCQIVQLRGNTRTPTGALRCFSLRNSDPSCCWMRQWRRQTETGNQTDRCNSSVRFIRSINKMSYHQFCY